MLLRNTHPEPDPDAKTNPGKQLDMFKGPPQPPPPPLGSSVLFTSLSLVVGAHFSCWKSLEFDTADKFVTYKVTVNKSDGFGTDVAGVVLRRTFFS